MRAIIRPHCLRAILIASAFCLALPALGQTISYVTKPAAVGSGLQSSQVRARLSTGAHGGITVRVQSADTNLAFISDAEATPGSEFVDIFVPNGSIDAIFWIQGLENTTGTVTITASAIGFADGIDTVDIAVPAVQITGLTATHNVLDPVDEFRAQVGLPLGSLLGVVQNVRAGGPGLTATLTNSDAAVGELVTTALTAQVVTVIIAPGQSSSPATVVAGGVAVDFIGAGSSNVIASIPGFIQVNNATRPVNVSAASASFIGLPASIGVGLQKGFLRGRLSGTEHGGTMMRIESGDSTQVLISQDRYTLGTGLIDVFIPDGSLDVIFYAQVLDTTATGPIGITASAPGFATANSTINVVDPFFRINSLQASTDILDPVDEFNFSVGLPNVAQTLILESQEARGGGPGLTFLATSSDSTVGLLETTGARNDTVAVPIDPGEFVSASTIAAGGVGFDGVGVGTVQVTGSSPGFFPITAGTVNVTVTQPGLNWINVPVEGVGAGLQSPSVRVRLQASSHGGVTVHIASRDSNLVLVSPDDEIVGAGSIDIPVANGSTDAFLFLQGLEDTTGTVTLYAEAPGFTPDSTTVNLVEPLIRIASGSLAGTLDTLDPPDDFFAYVGLVSGPSFLIHEVRPGAQDVVVTVLLDTMLADLRTLGGVGDSVTVLIPALSGSSPTSYGNGGVSLDGLAPGSVTVSVSAPGFAPLPEANQTVTITAPTLQFNGLAGDVGAGLQTSQLTVLLSASGHGGVSVHIDSGDSTLSLATTALTGDGSRAIDVPVPDGETIARFYVQGLDDTTGSVTYTASAPGFTGVDATINVVQPAVQILALESAIDVADGADPFWAFVGVPTLDQSAIGIPQSRRGGAPPLLVSMETSAGLVSRLRAGTSISDSVTVMIAAGSNVSPGDLFAGGVQHEPQAAGQTLVTASIPGFIQTGAAQQVVNITNQNTFIAGILGRLGAGLQTPVLTAQLGEPNHGGVTMHIEVDDSTRALVSLNALVVGARALDVPLANGNTDVPFYVQSADSSLGPVIVTASVPGYPTVVDTIEVVPAGLEIIALTDSLITSDPDDEFLVRVGAVNSDSTGIAEPQGVWAGSDTAHVTVSSSDITVGEIASSLDLGGAVMVDIPPGGVQTAGTVLAGGVAFHPAGGTGTTQVAAAIPGFLTTPAGSTTVFVNGMISGTSPLLPPVFSLGPNVPNPFNPATTISFTLPERGHVNLRVFDVRGRRVATLVDGAMPAGLSSVVWDGRDQAGSRMGSGVYFYRIVAGSQVDTRKMVLLK